MKELLDLINLAASVAAVVFLVLTIRDIRRTRRAIAAINARSNELLDEATAKLRGVNDELEERRRRAEREFRDEHLH